MAEILGEYIDRLCTIEMRPSGGNLPRGITHQLYASARERFDRPLTFMLAECLLERIEIDDAVFLMAGAGGPPLWPFGEVDGLLGAAVLARALHFVAGARPVFLGEERVEAPLRAACRAAGLNFLLHSEEVSSRKHTGVFVPMPLDEGECEMQAPQVLDYYDPTAVIAIEKLSPNHLGIIHGATGLNYHNVHCKPQYIFEEARRRQILTAGIGDAGNEIGFGAIREAVANIMPNGKECRCPCGGGSAAAVVTDLLVVAAISDWGAFGVAAMLGYLSGQLDVFIDEDDLGRILGACIDAGAVDGIFARPILCDDGVPLRVQQGFIGMLRGCVAIAQSRVESPGH